MFEKLVDIVTDDGTMNTYTYCPDEGGPFPVVFYYHDAAGAREAHADACRRLASCGYFVAMPNLYYRRVRYLDIDVDRFPDPAYGATNELMASLSNGLTITNVMHDTKCMLDLVATNDKARSGKIGVLGYCMSGRFAYRAMGEFPDQVAAGIAMYGSRLVTDKPDSAHLTTKNIKGEMYFGFAQHEVYFSTDEAMPQVQACFDQAGVKVRIELYRGREHGFALRGRRVYHKDSSETHWTRICDIFGRNLQPHK